jgi:hypothetical protein
MSNLQHLARALGGEVSGGQIRAPGPGHSALDRSLSVKLDSDAPDGFIVHSFAGDDPIVCRDHVRQKTGTQPFQANGRQQRVSDDEISKAVMAAVAAQTIPQAGPRGTHTATYRYEDRDGSLLYEVLRYDNPKDFRQRRPNGNGGWIEKGSERRVLYRWPELLQFPDATVFVCEGEKDADRVASLNHCATTVANGKWTQDCVNALAGRDCLILEDNDETGRKKALEAATLLHGVAKTIRIVRLPDLAEGGDVSDWLDANSRNAEKLVEICFDAPAWHPESQRQEAEGSQTNAVNALKLTYFDQLTVAAPKPWLIKNVIARGEASSWIGPPGKGKSALLVDIAIHLAGGGEYWRGYRIRGSCGVLYLPLERADLVKRRLFAHRVRNNLPSLPIAVSSQVIDLMNRNCVELLLNTIDQAEQHFGCEIGLVTIDTYPKGIAAGGGDENQAKDQNIVLANLRRVMDHKNVHIAGIGHTGKDENKGERGSNARLADVDALVQISGDAIKTATVKKANDQPEGELTSFRLEPYDFGVDEDGDPFRTYIVAEEILTGIATDRPLSDQQRLALDALTEAILSHGRDAPTEYRLPQGIRVVSAETWKEELYRRNVLDRAAKNPRARFGELRIRLAGKRLIGSRDDFVWPAAQEKQP